MLGWSHDPSADWPVNASRCGPHTSAERQPGETRCCQGSATTRSNGSQDVSAREVNESPCVTPRDSHPSHLYR